VASEDGRNEYHASTAAVCITGGSTIIDERWWTFAIALLSKKNVALRNYQREKLSSSWQSIKNTYLADQAAYKLFTSTAPLVQPPGQSSSFKALFPEGYFTVSRDDINKLFEPSIAQTVQQATEMINSIRDSSERPTENLTIVLTGGLSKNKYLCEQIKLRLKDMNALVFERPPHPCTKAVADGAVIATVDGFVSR